MLRKPQCHFGWDWNIAIAPLGLYGTVAIRMLDPARIVHVETRQIHQTEWPGEVTVKATLYASAPAVVPVHFEFDGERVRLDCGVNCRETVISHVFEVEHPRLWWPAGSGEQGCMT